MQMHISIKVLELDLFVSKCSRAFRKKLDEAIIMFDRAIEINQNDLRTCLFQSPNISN